MDPLRTTEHTENCSSHLFLEPPSFVHDGNVLAAGQRVSHTVLCVWIMPENTQVWVVTILEMDILAFEGSVVLILMLYRILF